MNWTMKLQESGQKYVQNIIDQIPNERGERDAFIDLLNKIAGEGGSKFKYLIVDEDGTATGTDDEDIAKGYYEHEDYVCTVIDVETGTDLTAGGKPVEEANAIDDSPDDDDD